jgi:O-succinylbenzoic acid--CoA ligase
LVELNDHSEFQWLGRIDNVVNSGGIKFIPEIIEEKLTKLIPRRYFIASESDPVLGDKLILLVEGEPMEIKDEVFSVLTKFEKPKNIYFIKHFEETHNGKIMRHETLNKFKS